MNNLIVFDIDGTLIHYIDFEDHAYLDAIHSVAGIESINTQWDNYSYSTESGILSEIFNHALKRNYEETELEAIKEHYVNALSHHIKNTPDALRCIPGATDVFKQVMNQNWDVAIATGGWCKTALMKLDLAKISYENIPIAHGDDHYDRKEIILTAVSRAKGFYNKNHYDTILYVGDRLWDLNATRSLGIGFIGVGHHLQTIKKDIPFFHVIDYSLMDFMSYLKKLQVIPQPFLQATNP